MKLYEIQTPAPQSAEGDLYGYARQDQFAGELRRIAGGYSRRAPVEGVWRDDSTSKVFREPMTPYHVALAEPARLNEIMAAASRIWPKEVAWYVAELGEVTIWPATVPGDSSPPQMTDDEIVDAIWPAAEYKPSVGDEYPASAPLGRIAASRESAVPGATLQAKPHREEAE